MLTLDEILEKLKDRNLQSVAHGAGLNPHTVYRVVKGEVKPLYDTVKRLSDYLESANG